MTTTPSHMNHRDSMRKRMTNKGVGTVVDYELIEVLLFYTQSRGDTKPLAKALLQQFKTIHELVYATREDITSIKGAGPATALLFELIREVNLRISKEAAFDQGPLLQSWQAVITYCREQIGRSPTEKFMALYLNSSNRLIEDDVLDTGTVNRVTVYPREIVKTALSLNAVAVIIVHNHPSDDTTPSKQDIAMTKAIRDALKTVDIILHDHLIIGKSSDTSFKQLGLM